MCAARSKDHDVTTTSQQTLGIKYGLSNNHPRRCDETEDASGILPPPPLPHWLIIYWMWNDYLNTKDQTARQAETIDRHHDRQTHHCGLRGSVIPELSAGGRLAYSGQFQWRSDSQRLHMSEFSQTNWFSSYTWMTAFWAY